MYCYSRGSEFIRLPGPYRTLPYRIRLEFLSRSRSLCARRTVVLPKILRFSAKKAISANRTVFSRVGDCDPIADCDPNFSDHDPKFWIAIRDFRIAIQNGLRSGVGSRIGSKQSPTLVFRIKTVLAF
jgi:hypothetical protein